MVIFFCFFIVETPVRQADTAGQVDVRWQQLPYVPLVCCQHSTKCPLRKSCHLPVKHVLYEKITYTDDL